MSRLLIFSGAGISAESGVSTFRDTDGLWAKHDVDKVCNYVTWKQNYDAVHDFYNQLRVGMNDKFPNAAHQYVKEWSDRYFVHNITQNVDDLFERAGCEGVMHLHGHLTEMKCTACGHIWDIGYRAYNQREERCASPKCECRKGIKPNIVFFHEGAPLYSAFHRILEVLTDEDVVLVIGTASQVVNIGGLLENRPGFKILNNIEPSESAYDRSIEDMVYDEKIFLPATEAAEKIDKILRERLPDK